MTDIVERLRDRGVCSIAHNSCRNDFVCEKAADEIERLREALREIADRGCETFHINPLGGDNICVEGGYRFAHERDVVAVLDMVRAALKEAEHE